MSGILMLDLYRMKNNIWVVKTGKTGTTVFPSIEEASEFMLGHGVMDAEIDNALIEMIDLKHTRAQFGINGYFLFSDDKEAFDT